MGNIVSQYMNWLHTRWPAGTVEKMPDVGEDGATAVTGVRVVGDLTGIPLLKFSADTGARAVQAFLKEPNFSAGGEEDVFDVVILGAGVSGISAALEAKKAGLRYRLFEAAEPFNTIVNFPKGKPIYTYPTEMVPAGDIQFTANVKEALLDELNEQKTTAGIEITQERIDRLERSGDLVLVHHAGKDKKVTKAKRVVVGIGRSGNYRRLGVPGQDLDKVYHRLYDPKEYAGQQALVVGGGDSALETAIALATCGAHVTVSYRKPEFSRPKPDNIERIRELQKDPDADVSIEQPISDRVTTAASKMMRGDAAPGSITLMMASKLKEVRPQEVILQDSAGQEQTLKNDVVFAMIGREAPLDFFRRSGIPIRGEWSVKTWLSFTLFMLFCFWLYNWKSGSGFIHEAFFNNGWFPYNVPAFFRSLSTAADDPSTLLGTLSISMAEPGFYYTLAYSVCVFFFGIARIRRRKTPYITAQTSSLIVIQLLPLFLLPYVILPLMGHNGLFDSGFGKVFADNLFPSANYGHGREYWRAFGFILAWPLFIWNFFTTQPMWWWLIIGGVQTFVIIPLIIFRWGKGAYCGWICSCGALAETLGDTQRTKMPHGPLWNRVNMVGQAILAVAFLLLGLRIYSWAVPGTWAGQLYDGLLSGWKIPLGSISIPINYYNIVDIFIAGIVGVGFYFWFSGRVWCRFACPLAALMHIYARFSRFRIFPDKSKCISCNVCTSVCHQGIDIMNFANKGLPMQDPECVRCSACVQQCPTGVLSFGRYTSNGLIQLDSVKASPVQIREARGG